MRCGSLYVYVLLPHSVRYLIRSSSIWCLVWFNLHCGNCLGSLWNSEMVIYKNWNFIVDCAVHKSIGQDETRYTVAIHFQQRCGFSTILVLCLDVFLFLNVLFPQPTERMTGRPYCLFVLLTGCSSRAVIQNFLRTVCFQVLNFTDGDFIFYLSPTPYLSPYFFQ